MKYWALFLEVLFAGITAFWLIGCVVMFLDRQIVDPNVKYIVYVTATACVGVWAGRVSAKK